MHQPPTCTAPSSMPPTIAQSPASQDFAHQLLIVARRMQANRETAVGQRLRGAAGAHVDVSLCPVEMFCRNRVFERAAAMRRYRHEVGAVAVGNRVAGELPIDVEIDRNRRIGARVARPAADRARLAHIDDTDERVTKRTSQELHASPRGAGEPRLSRREGDIERKWNSFTPPARWRSGRTAAAR